jgi:hypothetical protein
VEKLANKLIATKAFWRYVKSKWLAKIKMWVVGNRNLPYAKLDTKCDNQELSCKFESNFMFIKMKISREASWLGDTCPSWWHFASLLV